MEKWKIRRQDGKFIEVALDANGCLDWEINHVGEWYLLNVEDGTGATICVGVYENITDAREDAEGMTQDGIIPVRKISAHDYLKGNVKFTPALAREVKGKTALEYLNDEEPEDGE